MEVDIVNIVYVNRAGELKTIEEEKNESSIIVSEAEK